MLKLTGKINFATVTQLRQWGEAQILQNTELQFDFVDISSYDSSVLALLIAWKRFAKKRGVHIEFLHLPESLQTLATVCNVQSIITKEYLKDG